MIGPRHRRGFEAWPMAAGVQSPREQPISYSLSNPFLGFFHPSMITGWQVPGNLDASDASSPVPNKKMLSLHDVTSSGSGAINVNVFTPLRPAGIAKQTASQKRLAMCPFRRTSKVSDVTFGHMLSTAATAAPQPRYKRPSRVVSASDARTPSFTSGIFGSETNTESSVT